MELSSVAIILKAFYRMVGATSSDPALVLNGESADDVAYQYLTRGCRVAQRYLLSAGFQGWRKRSTALTFSGADATDGGTYTTLPSDFLRAYGTSKKSALVQADGTRWGTEIGTEDEESFGPYYYFRGSSTVPQQLWLARAAGQPSPLYLDYHYVHPVWSSVTTIDFPLEVRALIQAQAAELAIGEEWVPLDAQGEAKLERALKKAQSEAREFAAQSKEPRSMRRPYRLANHY